jgi:hypothetical protein
LKVAIVLSSHENACGGSIALDGADSGVAEQFAREYSSTSACE